MAGTDGVVIGIEQIAPAWFRPAMVWNQPGHVGTRQQEFLKEPGGVRQVPFRWAGIRHALQHQVLWFQRCDQPFTGGSHRLQSIGQEGAWTRPWSGRGGQQGGATVDAGAHPGRED